VLDHHLGRENQRSGSAHNRGCRGCDSHPCSHLLCPWLDKEGAELQIRFM